MEPVNFRRWNVKELRAYLIQYGVNMKDIQGSGTNGNITKADLINTIEKIEEGVAFHSQPNRFSSKLSPTKLSPSKYNPLSFDQLPGDVQAEIFNKDMSLSRKSPYISKSINRSTNQNICQLPISSQEVVNYVNTYVFLVGGTRESTKFNVNKNYLVKYPTNNQPAGYYIMVEWIYLNPNNTINLKFDYNNTDFFRRAAEAQRVLEYDLLTSYHIYNNRLSCNIPFYAKNKVINILNSKQVDLNTSYVKLLSWYMYLRTNLDQFPVLLPKNNYFDYKVTMDKDNIILVEPYINPVELMNQLKSQCQHMYQLLLKQLNLLE